MSTTVTYKGATLTTAQNQTRVMKTAGKYMEDDVTIVDVTPSTNYQTKSISITPSETAQSQTISPDSPTYDALSGVSVSVGAVPSTYVGSGITRQSSLSVSGASVTAPVGYYENPVTVTITSGSASTPATTITANPTISIDSSGMITASVSASQSITPTVSAGYISSGTSGTVSVSGSGTHQLTTQGATTITPSASQQTAVSSGTYVTGNIIVDPIPLGSAGTPTATKGTVNNHSITVTPSVTNTTGYITGSIITGTGVTVDASELVSGNLPITSNGNNIDVTNYATVSVNVAGQSKNVQIASGVNRVATTSYTAVSGQSLTVAKTGTYDVYWSGYRSSTSGTSGSQLYIGNTAYGSAQTTFSNNGQSVHLSNVSLTQNQTITVRARSRNTSSYMYVANLTIVEA